MKKLIASLVCVFGFANFTFADFEKNFINAIKSSTEIDVKIEVKKPLKSLEGQFFVIASTKNGEIFPVIVGGDGRYFVGLSSVMHFDDSDSKMITDEIYKAGAKYETQKAKKLNALFKTFKASDFVVLESNKKLPTKIVITDPDCPYCRKELENIEKVLKEANVKLIFAPVHDEKAFIKAQLILNETAKLKNTDIKEKIAILRKYYADITLNEKQLKTDFKRIKEVTTTIFNSGLVRGVPYSFNEE